MYVPRAESNLMKPFLYLGIVMLFQEIFPLSLSSRRKAVIKEETDLSRLD